MKFSNASKPKTVDIETLRQLAQEIPKKNSYLKALILFGSRATGDLHDKSDWDFAVAYDLEKLRQSQGDLLQISQIIGEALEINSDHVDVVDLDQATPLLAHFIARDGMVIYEQEVGYYQQLKQKFLLKKREFKELEQGLKDQISTFLKEWAEI